MPYDAGARAWSQDSGDFKLELYADDGLCEFWYALGSEDFKAASGRRSRQP